MVVVVGHTAFKCVANKILRIAASCDGRYLAILASVQHLPRRGIDGRDNTNCLFMGLVGSTAPPCRIIDNVTCISWAPSQAVLATGHLDGAVYLWHFDEQHNIFVKAHTLIASAKSSASSIAWLSDSDLVIGFAGSRTCEPHLRIWTDCKFTGWRPVITGHPSSPNVTPPDAPQVFAARANLQFIVSWPELQIVGEKLSALAYTDIKISSASWATNEFVCCTMERKKNNVYLGSKDKLVKHIDAHDVRRVAWSPDQKWIALMFRRHIKLWHVETQQMAISCELLNGTTLSDVCWAPDSTQLYGAACDKVFVWDLHDLRPKHFRYVYYCGPPCFSKNECKMLCELECFHCGNGLV